LNNDEKVILIQKKIVDFIRHAALERVRLHSRLDNFTLVDKNTEYQAGQILGNWMALILVSGDSLRITLKLHFCYTDIKKIAYLIYGKQSPDELSDQQTLDFVKELCNLTAGYLVQIFEDNDLHIGISLPLCTRGFYEIFSDYKSSSYPIIKYNDIWSLEHEDIHIFGSVIIELLDTAPLEKILAYEIPDEDEDDDDEEMDFL
jgi:CheY-specific phosphatase CheX